MEHTDADCKTLQTTTKATYSKASDAAKAAGKKYKACTTATYKPVKTAEELAAFCKADKDAQTAPDARKAQVKVWVDNVNAALTNNYVSDKTSADYQEWQTTWFQNGFKSSKTLAEAKKHQDAATSAYNSSKSAVATAESKVDSTKATEASDKAKVASTKAAETKADTANKAVGHDAATLKAYNDAKTAAADAVTAHTKSVTAAAAAVTAHTAAVTK